MIIVSVTGTVKPEFKEAFIHSFTVLRPVVLAEKGCHRYEHYLSPESDRSVFIYEEWESREDLEAHLDSEHMKRFFKQSGAWFEALEMKTHEAREIFLAG